MNKKYKISNEQLIEAVKNSKSRYDCLTSLGMNPDGGGNYFTLKKRVELLQIDCSHWKGRNWNKGMTYEMSNRRVPLTEILIQNSKSSSNKVKNRLLKEKLIEYKCSICFNSGDWLGQKLVLHLDHINGVNNDNRLENLRLLCPNCHSQTSTYCGKNITKSATKQKYEYFSDNKSLKCNKRLCKKTKRKKLSTRKCLDCNNFLSLITKGQYCKKCYLFHRSTKIIWPSDEELQNLICKTSLLQLSKQLGVSDNAIRKRAARKGLKLS